MYTYLISYDLVGNEDIESYNLLYNEIKNYGAWAKPLESLRLIKSNESIERVTTKLKAKIDSNDKLLVFDVTGDNWYSFNLSNSVINWMQGI